MLLVSSSSLLSSRVVHIMYPDDAVEVTDSFPLVSNVGIDGISSCLSVPSRCSLSALRGTTMASSMQFAMRWLVCLSRLACRWAYRCEDTLLACPSCACTSYRVPPLLTMRAATEWRQVCKQIGPSILARLTMRWNGSYTLCSGCLGLSPGNTYGLPGIAGICISIWVAMWFRCRMRLLPFLV